MPKYVIEREIPGAGKLSREQLQAISQKSCGVLSNLGPQIQWVESYVMDDRVYCVYIAANEELIREHARQGGFPANRISEVHAGRTFALHLGGKNLVHAALGDPVIVVFRIKGIGRKLETAATFDSAMTGRLVAATFSKDAANIACKSERTSSVRAWSRASPARAAARRAAFAIWKRACRIG
jgi:hypothetical protein